MRWFLPIAMGSGFAFTHGATLPESRTARRTPLCASFSRAPVGGVGHRWLDNCGCRSAGEGPVSPSVVVFVREFVEQCLSFLNGVEFLRRRTNHHRLGTRTGRNLERSNRTLKHYWADRAEADSLAKLQHQLDTFKHKYKENPSGTTEGFERATPSHAYTEEIRPQPRDYLHFDQNRVRFDWIDESGKVTLRGAEKMP
jgi:hypothetical protein